jgi:hypothetical protein
MAYDTPPYPFDHTSISATLHDLFGMPGSLTRRDAVAPSLLGALCLPNPTNDGPLSVEPPKPDIPRAEVRAACSAPPNRQQDLLSRMAMVLPARPGLDQAAVPSQSIPDTGFANVQSAGLHAVARIKTFLGM